MSLEWSVRPQVRAKFLTYLPWLSTQQRCFVKSRMRTYTYCHTYYYWYSITHSLFHSWLKFFLLCKSSLPQPFLFLLQDSLYGFPRLFTVTSEHIRLFTFQFFFCFYTFLVVGSVRQIKLTRVGFRAHVKIASRIASYARVAIPRSNRRREITCDSAAAKAPANEGDFLPVRLINHRDRRRRREWTDGPPADPSNSIWHVQSSSHQRSQ